jgi:hypothetical protein
MLSHAVDNAHLLLPVASFHVTYFIQLTDHLTVNYGWSHSLTSNEIYVPQFLNRHVDAVADDKKKSFLGNSHELKWIPSSSFIVIIETSLSFFNINSRNSIYLFTLSVSLLDVPYLSPVCLVFASTGIIICARSDKGLIVIISVNSS